MTITAIFTNKGGVAKTMLTANLAAEMSNAGARVAVVDLDPQSNLSDLLLGEMPPAGTTTVDGIMAPVVRGSGEIERVQLARSEAFGVDILPCTPRLALIEDFLAGEWRQACGADVRGVNATLAIRNAIHRVAEDYDHVLIDCGPMLGSLNRAGLIAADSFVSPVTRDRFCVMALQNAREWISGWKANWDRVPVIMAATRSTKGPDLPGIASFAGYVVTHASGYIPEGQFEAELSEAAADWDADAPLLGTIPHTSTAFHAKRHRVPFAALGPEHGLTGSQFAQRVSASDAHARIPAAFIHPDPSPHPDPA